MVTKVLAWTRLIKLILGLLRKSGGITVKITVEVGPYVRTVL